MNSDTKLLQSMLKNTVEYFRITCNHIAGTLASETDINAEKLDILLSDAKAMESESLYMQKMIQKLKDKWRDEDALKV